MLKQEIINQEYTDGKSVGFFITLPGFLPPKTEVKLLLPGGVYFL